SLTDTLPYGLLSSMVTSTPGTSALSAQTSLTSKTSQRCLTAGLITLPVARQLVLLLSVRLSVDTVQRLTGYGTTCRAGTCKLTVTPTQTLRCRLTCATPLPLPSSSSG